MRNDVLLKIISMIVPILLAVSGWAFSLEGRLRDVSARQEERGPRLDAVEHDIAALRKAAIDPAGIDTRLSRLEDRLNNLHMFLLQAVKPGRGGNLMLQQRGDLQPAPPPFKQEN